MAVDWMAINRDADDVLVGAGIVVLIGRQFIWRSAELRRMLVLPLVIIAVGTVYLVAELGAGSLSGAGDWVILAELALVALTGTAMGYVTRFRTQQDRLQYKLTTPGLLLWVVFVGLRLGSFYLAAALGARLAATLGPILLSFGVNRVAAVLVVRRRARARLASS
jgi:hypothetical protein